MAVGQSDNLVGRHLADLRKSRNLTLNDVSGLTGVSVSSLSKIENGLSQPSFSVLNRLAEGLQLDLSMVMGQPLNAFASGVREITRAGKGTCYATDMGQYEDIASTLSGKAMAPMLIDIPHRNAGSPPVRSQHRGQEYVFVLTGPVTFEMAFYAPMSLQTGDSVYFDASTDHGFSAQTTEGARILSVCYAGATDPSRSQIRPVRGEEMEE